MAGLPIERRVKLPGVERDERALDRRVSGRPTENGTRSEASNPQFPLPQEGMALISLTKASLGARVFWLQGEGDSQQIEGALLQRGGRRGLVELDRRV
jgi:hypothetical protein